MASAKNAVPGEHPEARAGTNLSNECEEALATDAEAGFDPAGLSAGSGTAAAGGPGTPAG